MSYSGPRELISREEIRAVYARGEEAVIELVEGWVEKLGKLEERVEALEGKDKKNSSLRVDTHPQITLCEAITSDLIDRHAQGAGWFVDSTPLD